MSPEAPAPESLSPGRSAAGGRRLRMAVGLGLAFAILVVDRLVKEALVARFVERGEPWPVEITSFFNLVMVWNRGISFGLFQGDETGRWILVALAAAISLLLVVWLARAAGMLAAVALGLVLGGAVGNAWDRFQWGAVADFFDVHAFGYHFWAFNVADMGISVGVGLLLLDGLFARGPEA